MAPIVLLYRLQFGGKIFQSERWSCSLMMHAPGAVFMTAQQAYTPLNAWFTRSASRCSAAATLDEVKFNNIVKSVDIKGVHWRYPVGHITDVFAPAAPSTGNSQATYPQVSLTVGLTTLLPRGRGHAGRIYPPSGQDTIASELDPSGRMPGAAVAAVAGSFRTLVTELNALGPKVCVFSARAESIELVTGVRVGRVVDTMRSRRTSLPEEYTNVPL